MTKEEIIQYLKNLIDQYNKLADNHAEFERKYNASVLITGNIDNFGTMKWCEGKKSAYGGFVIELKDLLNKIQEKQ